LAVNKTQELGAAVSKIKRETGESAEEASKLIYAFEHYGLTSDDASKSLGILSKKLKGVEDEETGVAEGGKSTAAILADIGVKATDATGNLLPMADIMPQIADYFKTLPDGVEKTGLAMQLFGRSGKDMIPILNQGSVGLEELGKQAEKMGVVLSEKNVADIKKYTFAQREMKAGIEGVKLQIGLALIPTLTKLTAGFVEVLPHIRALVSEGLEKLSAFMSTSVIPALKEFWQENGPAIIQAFKDMGEIIQTKVIPFLKAAASWLLDFGKTALEMGQSIAKFLAPALDTLADLWTSALQPALEAIMPYLKQVWDFLSAHKEIIIAVAAAILLLINPWLAVVAAIAVVLAKWDEISKFFSVDVPGAIDDFLDKIGEIPIIGEIFKGAFEACKVIVETVFGLIKNSVETQINAIKDIITIVTALIRGDWEGAWNGIKDLVSGIWDGIKKQIEIVLGGIRDLLNVYAGTFLGAIKDGWELVKTFFTDTIPNWFQNNWKDILIGVFGGIPILLLTKFKDKIWDAVTTVSGSLLEAGQDIAADIWEGITDLWGKATELITGFCTGLSMALIGAMGTLIDWGKKVVGWEWEGLKTIFSMAWDMINELIRGLHDAITEKAGDFIDLGKKVVGFLNPFGSPETVAYYTGQDIITDLSKGMLSNISAILMATQGCLEVFIANMGGPGAIAKLGAIGTYWQTAMQEWLGGVRNIAAQGGTEAAIMYVKKLLAMLGDSATPATDALKVLLAQLELTGKEEGAKGGVNTASSLVDNLIAETQANESSVGSDVANSLRSAMASFSGEAVEWGKSIAEYIMTGIYRGFVDNFAGWAADIATIIYDKLKEALGAGSPAKKMIPLGAMAAQGYAQGWQGALALPMPSPSFGNSGIGDASRAYVHAGGAVVPARGSSGGGDTINVYVQGSILSERDLKRVVAEGLRRGEFRGMGV